MEKTYKIWNSIITAVITILISSIMGVFNRVRELETNSKVQFYKVETMEKQASTYLPKAEFEITLKNIEGTLIRLEKILENMENKNTKN